MRRVIDEQKGFSIRCQTAHLCLIYETHKNREKSIADVTLLEPCNGILFVFTLFLAHLDANDLELIIDIKGGLLMEKDIGYVRAKPQSKKHQTYQQQA